MLLLTSGFKYVSLLANGDLLLIISCEHKYVLNPGRIETETSLLFG